MTGQRLKLVAAMAAAAALLAIAARPLLQTAPDARPLPVPPTAASAPAGAATAALRAARAALACRPGRHWRTRACGELADTDADAYRIAAARVVVLLAGTLRTYGSGAIPVAVRVSLSPTSRGWDAEVALP